MSKPIVSCDIYLFMSKGFVPQMFVKLRKARVAGGYLQGVR